MKDENQSTAHSVFKQSNVRNSKATGMAWGSSGGVLVGLDQTCRR